MSTPSRRWPRVRFRLWHLLALVTLLCGWLGFETNRARKIEAVTAAVRGKQGWVRYRHRFTHHSWWDDSGKRAALLGGFGRPGLPAPEWMIKLSSLYYFVSPTVIVTTMGPKPSPSGETFRFYFDCVYPSEIRSASQVVED